MMKEFNNWWSGTPETFNMHNFSAPYECFQAGWEAAVKHLNKLPVMTPPKAFILKAENGK